MKRSQLGYVLPALLAVLLMAGCTHNQKVTSKRATFKGAATHQRDDRTDHRYPEEHHKRHGRLGMQRVSLPKQPLPAQTKVRTQQYSSSSRPTAQSSAKPTPNHQQATGVSVSQWQHDVPTRATRQHSESAHAYQRHDVFIRTQRHHEKSRKILVGSTFNDIHEHRLSFERQQPSVMQEKYTPRQPVPTEVIF